ncbi:alkylated DNA repair protein (DNA oxidative demethylase) [Pseudorhizobium tarimense]|uniref:Alkylated DNA repair protein (DNA oxidative demethylase) n=1 Tax=Pseudorhizobium tarimense TaxID=1079109 RepID=A0ABV2H8E2_9HYPH|nr:alpha-ketoglutarate-dependent dioxygenase AlkB [Pseudorhizobium tarimense]MCJ8519789.1 alpha-ketoglutarate-dependent dioxygenase AlkB [Pseudorhizobium tarimense]
MADLPEGLKYLPGYLDRPAQEGLVDLVRHAVADAPLYVPVMPGTGKPMSVQMTNLGPLGWVTDKERGYRYQATHPVTGKPWPAIPEALLSLWDTVSNYPEPPQACLVNFYADDARMGLHQDKDEKNFAAPVVSISLGNTCLFRVGGLNRKDPTRSFRLASGDVVVLGGASRLCFHGVDRIYPDTSTLLKNGGRINLTLRRVTLL